MLTFGPYMLFCTLFPIIIGNIPRRIFPFITFYIASISFGMMGPSENILRMPK